MSNQAARLVTVSKLYRDALKIAEIVAYQQGQDKRQLKKMVGSAFRSNAHLVLDDDIQAAKQSAIMAMGNYHALMAVDLATQYRDKQILSRAESSKRARSRA